MQYLLALYHEESGWEDVTPEQIREMMGPWNEFEQQIVDAGVKVAGEALQQSTNATTVKITEGDDRPVTDGPFVEAKEQLGGFYLLDCENLDEALEWAKKVPLQPGGSVEVRPVMDFEPFGFEAPEQEGDRGGPLMKFMLTMIGPEGDWADSSPEQLQEEMARWQALGQELRDAGVHIAGEGLEESPAAKTVRIADDGERMVADGPYAESKEQVGGFYLLDCASIDEAVEWAKKVPIPAGGIEVRPVADYSDYESDEAAATTEAS